MTDSTIYESESYDLYDLLYGFSVSNRCKHVQEVAYILDRLPAPCFTVFEPFAGRGEMRKSFESVVGWPLDKYDQLDLNVSADESSYPDSHTQGSVLTAHLGRYDVALLLNNSIPATMYKVSDVKRLFKQLSGCKYVLVHLDAPYYDTSSAMTLEHIKTHIPSNHPIREKLDNVEPSLPAYCVSELSTYFNPVTDTLTQEVTATAHSSKTNAPIGALGKTTICFRFWTPAQVIDMAATQKFSLVGMYCTSSGDEPVAVEEGGHSYAHTETGEHSILTPNWLMFEAPKK